MLSQDVHMNVISAILQEQQHAMGDTNCSTPFPICRKGFRRLPGMEKQHRLCRSCKNERRNNKTSHMKGHVAETSLRLGMLLSGQAGLTSAKHANLRL